MKTVLKVLTFGMMLMAFAVAPAFAQQQEECDALYKKYMDNYKGPEIAKRKTAVEVGEQYLAKCAAIDADITKYLEKAVPPIKKKIDFEETAEAFNNAVKDAKNVNTDTAFSSGKRLLTAHDPNLIDVMITLAQVGFDKTATDPTVTTYNSEAINYARQAMQKIEGGTVSKQYGAFGYSLGTKENALAWMNYAIGYITYFGQKNKKDALPYLYKATRYETNAKNNPKNIALIYDAIGDYYRDDYNRIDDERTKLAAEAKAKTDEAEKKALIDKTKEMLLLQKGYAERMLDAYARAHANAGTNQAYKTELYDTMKVLYKVRFDKTDGLDAYLSSLMSKQMPDPTNAVTPVVDTTATTTTSTSTTSGAVTTTTNSRPTTDTKATTNGTTNTTTTKATTTTGKTTKTPAKPAPKKKGTR